MPKEPKKFVRYRPGAFDEMRHRVGVYRDSLGNGAEKMLLDCKPDRQIYNVRSPLTEKTFKRRYENFRHAEAKFEVIANDLFRAIFVRTPQESFQKTRKKTRKKTVEVSSQKSTLKSSQKILNIIETNNHITIEELSVLLKISDSAIKKQIFNLKKSGILERIGPDKGGYWKILKKG